MYGWSGPIKTHEESESVDSGSPRTGNSVYISCRGHSPSSFVECDSPSVCSKVHRQNCGCNFSAGHQGHVFNEISVVLRVVWPKACSVCLLNVDTMLRTHQDDFQRFRLKLYGNLRRTKCEIGLLKHTVSSLEVSLPSRACSTVETAYRNSGYSPQTHRAHAITNVQPSLRREMDRFVQAQWWLLQLF